MATPSQGKLTFAKFARGLTYVVYAYAAIATVTLIFGFFLLLFGANPNTPFVQFVYHLSARFMEPFRGIFPTRQISDRSYFSATGLFSIIFYSLFAMVIHNLISYITVKQLGYQKEIDAAKR